MLTFKLPRIQARLPIVNADGSPTNEFQRLFNIDLAQRIEQQEASQQAILDELAAQLLLIQAAQDTADAALAAASEAGGARYAPLNANAPALSASVLVTGVTAQTQLSISGLLFGGTLDADAQWQGEAVLTESDGTTPLVLLTIPITTESTGISPAPGEWTAESSSEIAGSAVGVYTGSVTYRISFTRTGGSNYVVGPDIRSTLTITPKAA